MQLGATARHLSVTEPDAKANVLGRSRSEAIQGTNFEESQKR